jgi:hypothetical protein
VSTVLDKESFTVAEKSSSSKPTHLDLVFVKDRDTKNKVRFGEKIEGKEEPAVQWLYVTKKRLKAMGDPDMLHVHIEGP